MKRDLNVQHSDVDEELSDGHNIKDGDDEREEDEPSIYGHTWDGV